ncbi:MAG TPA: GNAT family N-acetyltransferase [Micromonosporaceae bacterium]|nr:GNAT family N-acetyltransferase [Micromonosporaceae bacterium]
MLIRPATPEDAPAVVALRAHVYPYLVRGVESTRRMIAEPPPGEDWTAFVAEVDGQIVGWTSAHRNGTTSEAGFGEISLLHVRPDHRRTGIGSALLNSALRHLAPLGIRKVRGWVLAESLGFAGKHGFKASRELRYSGLELRLLPPLPAAPDGVRFRPLVELDPQLLYSAFTAASADVPGDIPFDAISYKTWRYEVWDNLGLDKAASTVAVVDGRLVAVSLLKRDGDRVWSDMTATLPAYRGRGLARLVKLAALHRAAAAGAAIAYTSNDAANLPMLAVNKRLGYQPVAIQWSCLADLTSPL